MTFGGKRSGHIFGFTKTILSFLGKDRDTPTAVVMSLDGHPKHKYDAAPSYKDNRDSSGRTGDPMPEISILARMLPGYHLYDPHQEADDCIAAFIHRLRRRERRTGRWRASVTVVSSDQDLLGLVGPDVLWQPRSHEPALGPKEVGAKLVGLPVRKKGGGFNQRHVALYKALCGDSSDNITGVPRLRRRNVALVLADTDGSQEQFLARVTAGDKRLSPKEREKIVAAWESVVKPNHALTLLNTSLRVWPVRNTTSQDDLHTFLVRRYGCRSLAEDIGRMYDRSP